MADQPAVTAEPYTKKQLEERRRPLVRPTLDTFDRARVIATLLELTRRVEMLEGDVEHLGSGR